MATLTDLANSIKQYIDCTIVKKSNLATIENTIPTWGSVSGDELDGLQYTVSITNLTTVSATTDIPTTYAVLTGLTAVANTALAKGNTALAMGNTAHAIGNTAYYNAGLARTAASTAQSTADTALAKGNTALAMGNTAYAIGNTAYYNAGLARTAASTAQSTANTAQSTANTASTNASTALTNASTALAIGNTAYAIGTNAYNIAYGMTGKVSKLTSTGGLDSINITVDAATWTSIDNILV